MIKQRWRLGLSIAAAALIMNAAGCKAVAADRALDGTWAADDGGGELTMRNGTFEISAEGIPEEKGTYSTADGSITRTTTGIHGAAGGLEYRWYSQKELKAAFIDKELPDEFLNTLLDTLFATRTDSYTVEGDTLTLKAGEDGTTYTKK